MRLLLDTPILLWWFDDSDTLSTEVKSAISDPEAEIVVSVASIWEISIKCAIGKLKFPVQRLLSLLEDSGFSVLPIDAFHAIAAGGLPLHHHDPFDRMLIAQARAEDLTFVTADPVIRRYGVTLLTIPPTA